MCGIAGHLGAPRGPDLRERMRAALEPSMYATDLAVDMAKDGVPFREAYRQAADPARWAEGDRYPQATDVALLAAPLFRAGKAISAEQALPVYLRDKVALTLEEQRAAR